MRFSALAFFPLLASSALGINILLNNDDGFGSAQLREAYRLLKKAGHNAVIVAPSDFQSGMGGRSVFADSPTLRGPSQYNLIPAGAPSLGRDPKDPDIWYYNGTPAACSFVGLDYVVPNYYKRWGGVDLLVSGPNFGTNLGPFLYTLSGTLGAAYAAIGRGVPGVAFSGGNSEQRSYQWINKTTSTGKPDPATLQAKIVVDVVSNLIKGVPSNQPILPIGYGVTVNSAYITSLENRTCLNPKFANTRLNPTAFTDKAVMSNGVFTYGNILGPGVNRIINGDPGLPGETDVVNGGCQASLSIFTVDYDAPMSADTAKIRKKLERLQNLGINQASQSMSTEEFEQKLPLRHG